MIDVHITVYSPQTGGHPIEGGLPSARRGLDGQFLVRTLDDVSIHRSEYVTLAGDPHLYFRSYVIPTITYVSYGAVRLPVSLTQVLGYVHDTGSAFIGKPEGRFDIAVGIDYTQAQINSQPFANHSATGPTEPKIALAPCHVVQPGQGWWRISRDYGVTMVDLIAVNNATIDTVLRPMDRLAIPGKSAKVAKGEGWWAVARRSGVSAAALMDVNLAGPLGFGLHTGDILTLP